jgi:hypothetical protein
MDMYQLKIAKKRKEKKRNPPEICPPSHQQMPTSNKQILSKSKSNSAKQSNFPPISPFNLDSG